MWRIQHSPNTEDHHLGHHGAVCGLVLLVSWVLSHMFNLSSKEKRERNKHLISVVVHAVNAALWQVSSCKIMSLDGKVGVQKNHGTG